MKARIPFAATAAAVLISAAVFGGAVGAWSAIGPAITIPAAISGSPDCPNTYQNVDDHQVLSPCGDWRAGQIPATATALCRDGTASSSAHRQGSFSHHGGLEGFLPSAGHRQS